MITVLGDRPDLCRGRYPRKPLRDLAKEAHVVLIIPLATAQLYIVSVPATAAAAEAKFGAACVCVTIRYAFKAKDE